MIATPGNTTNRVFFYIHHVCFQHLDNIACKHPPSYSRAITSSRYMYYDSTVTVLDGNVELRGIKIESSLVSGVVRGSSTVLAKVHPRNSTYTLVNMCADGYTYTDVMTTEEDHDKFAANLHVYPETGTRALDEAEPMIKLEGDTYYADSSLLAHFDSNSTDVYKIGYMISPNNHLSDILVYTGAKSDASRAMKSRFLYGYYHEEQ
ncbi:hypothetical protein BDB00DRAFT_525682 [Zychaea mexicana]|uniref:uncharacterized protein n=1 Tax=Zychaea mexicana TaxID=64656 RepID=UPI0022FDE347|nr:uncharacterized protein BDB00DRAFT_525682 [Zychaea mexicana]KAI9490901.1 hypothetical protein BDB00DRAFT_525682 [Zychaea mexicana]